MQLMKSIWNLLLGSRDSLLTFSFLVSLLETSKYWSETSMISFDHNIILHLLSKTITLSLDIQGLREAELQLLPLPEGI